MAPSKLAGTTLGSTTSVERRPKKERMTRHAHRREGRRRRLGAAASRGGRGVPAVVLSARARMGAEARRGELGRRRRRAALCPLLIRARSRGVDRGGAGAACAVFNREREEIGWAVLGKEMNLTGGPHPSAAREREGEPAGPRGFGPKWPKRGRGREIPFYFSNKFSIHFPNGFLINLTFVFKTLIT